MRSGCVRLDADGGVNAYRSMACAMQNESRMARAHSLPDRRAIGLPACTLLACTWLLHAHALAETPSRHALGFAVDLGVASTRDDILVPRAFSGPRLALELRYVGLLGPGLLQAELHVAAGYLLDRDAEQAIALDHAIDVQYAFPLDEKAAFQQALGPALGVDTDVAWLVSWDNAHAYWIATRWLGAAWRAFVPAWAGFRWDLAAELPLIGLLSRPEGYRHNKQDALDRVSFYFFDVQAHPKPVWFGELQQLRLTVDLWHSASNSFVAHGWALGAETRIVHATEPRSAFAFRAGLRFSASWGL
jgi:hypothetical protein